MTVGGDLNCFGNKYVSKHTFPFLRSVGGKLITENSGFTKQPDTLEEVGGDVVISRKDSESLLDDILKAKELFRLKNIIAINEFSSSHNIVNA